MFVSLMLQYAGYFLLIIPINWWHRRRGPAAYGLTRAGNSWTTLLLAGLAIFALAMWPGLGVTFANAIHPWARRYGGGRRFLTCPGAGGNFGSLAPSLAGAHSRRRRAFLSRRLPAAAGGGLGRRAVDHPNRLPVHLRAHPVSDTERVQRGHDCEPPRARDRVWSGVCLDPIADSGGRCPRHHRRSDDADLAGVILTACAIGAMITWRRGVAVVNRQPDLLERRRGRVRCTCRGGNGLRDRWRRGSNVWNSRRRGWSRGRCWRADASFNTWSSHLGLAAHNWRFPTITVYPSRPRAAALKTRGATTA